MTPRALAMEGETQEPAPDYDEFDGDCWQCGGEGYTFDCIDGCCLDCDVGCDLCTRRCDICNPRTRKQTQDAAALRQILGDALARAKKAHP